jgi:hypothetical protein
MTFKRLAYGVLGLICVVFTARSASAAGTTGTGPLLIEGKCVDAPGWSVENGTAIQIYDCNGGSNQEWMLWADGTIRPAFNTNKCLDLPGWETANGTPINIYDCNGGSNQQWTLGADNTLQGFGGKCIDNPGFQTENGTGFQYYDCNGGVNQAFTLGAAVSNPISVSLNFTFSNGVSVGGNTTVTLFPDGSFDFAGAFHDSGFWDYNVSLVCIAKDSNATGYSLTWSGQLHGSESLWLGGSRDASFSTSSSSDALKNAWWLLETEAQTSGDAISCRAHAGTDLNSLLNQFGAALGIAGTVLAVIAL